MEHGDLRKLRACMVCAVVLSFEQFKEDGCPNCEPLLEMRGSPDRVLDSTSPAFSGLIAMIRPSGSWVARWQRLEKSAAGLYAAKVFGRLPDDLRYTLEERQVRPAVADAAPL